MLTEEERKKKTRTYRRNYYLNNREKTLKTNREWRQNNAEYLRAYNAERRERGLKGLYEIRHKCSKYGLECDLTLEYIDSIMTTHCPILGFEFVRNIGSYGARYNSPSIDRIDPTKGYTKGNVQIISHKANTMKSNATPEELVKFATWVLDTYKKGNKQ